MYIYIYVCAYMYVRIRTMEEHRARPPHSATHCSTLQHTATHCNKLHQLQHMPPATCCNKSINHPCQDHVCVSTLIHTSHTSDWHIHTHRIDTLREWTLCRLYVCMCVCVYVCMCVCVYVSTLNDMCVSHSYTHLIDISTHIWFTPSHWLNSPNTHNWQTQTHTPY